MEDNRTEAEKCNRWLRIIGTIYYCVYDCGGTSPDYDVIEYYKNHIKEQLSPLVSKYLKSLESNDTNQRKKTILNIINQFDMEFCDGSDYPWDYKYVTEKNRKDNCFFYCRYKLFGIEDPRMFWFRKLIKEDISEVEICRMLLTCQELGEYEIGISLGQEYVENKGNNHSELLISLVNKHIEVLQEELRARKEYEDREYMEDINSMSISDYRDYRRELEEESWDAMTGGMYGDYEGDIDMDNLGY